MNSNTMNNGNGAGLSMSETKPMYFVGTWHEVLWLKGLETKHPATYVLSLGGLFLLAILHESISHHRGVFMSRATSSDPLLGGARPHMTMTTKLILTGLYASTCTTSYLLMLAVMTFNVGYFLAIIAGLAVGFYLWLDRPDSGRGAGSALSNSSHLSHSHACDK
mmetsp:Transcript_5951/g.14799  ORF Transcript_5951/g.14799 Transcript_5951/m.14799 type:complete len:164 (-) Transcript_5951:144-635(-)